MSIQENNGTRTDDWKAPRAGSGTRQAVLDPMLIALSLLGERDYSVPVTILTHGCTISGKAIGRRQYIERINECLRPQESQDNWLDLPGFFDLVSAAQEAEGPYLHLEDARVAGQEPASAPLSSLWRVKMSEIDGFRFGAD